MKKKIEVPGKIKRAILSDYKSGEFTQFGLVEKYGYSRAIIRRVLKDLNKDPVKEMSKAEAKIAAEQRVVTYKTEALKEVIVDGYIDVFESIRESVRDMIELNNEQKEALDELVQNVQAISDFVKNKTESLDPIRKQVEDALYQISSYWGRGKLRVMSRNELGKWIDRYKEFNMIGLQFNYYENLIKSFFEGINTLSADEYRQVRKHAIGVFGPVEKYFLANEDQASYR